MTSSGQKSSRLAPTLLDWRVTTLAFGLALLWTSNDCRADDASPAARYHADVQPILETYCYGCHGFGTKEGGRSFDEFASDEAMLADRALWWAVLKNVRSGVMPPAGEARPDEAEQKKLFEWIEQGAFGIDPRNPDPGRVTLRRLNRVEYRNTIRDLMGVDFDATNEFPADDAGYGFDNIGDVLSVSPLLLEKYLRAAEKVVEKAVPDEPYVVDEQRVEGDRFRSDDRAANGHRSANGDRMSYYTPATVARRITTDKDGTYRIIAELFLDGNFEFDPARCRVTFTVDGEPLHQTEYGWADKESRRFEVDAQMPKGKHELAFKLEPLVDEKEKLNAMDYRISAVLIRGPVETHHQVENKNYRRFFPDGPAPEHPQQRDAYTRKVLKAFAERAYRRPVEEQTVDRLSAIAKETSEAPGESFESSVGRAMVAVLASPRFLFRVEDPVAAPASELYPQIDEYALASRLSYFLWSSMPDNELIELAKRVELRSRLPEQVTRMIKDPRAGALARDFAGQWLRSRDVEHAEIEALAALGLTKEADALRAQFFALRGDRERRDRDSDDDDGDDEQMSPEEKQRRQQLDELRDKFRQFRELRESFGSELRSAMRRETEMHFEHLVREDRSVLELIDSDYAFLNEDLARHYDIPGVSGREMRRVELPEGSPRGGVLTQGTLLVVTSNPTRTSPVKRGLFILDNILGTPPPPPPANVPPLEAAGSAITDHEPTVRELQEQHRSDPLCSSCHARMDPLGLALENFNAMGMWREKENDRPIDASGTLLTGETFQGIEDVKRILMNERRLDFYRCITEKLFTYALGRGLEYYDEHTVDQIVEQLDRDQGKFSTLLMGVINSAPFQKQRRAESVAGTLRVP
jgi:hypothetical protein